MLTAVLTKTVLAKNKRLLTWSGTRFHRFQTSRCCLDMACRRGHAGKPDDANNPTRTCMESSRMAGPRLSLDPTGIASNYLHRLLFLSSNIWHSVSQYGIWVAN